MLYQKILIMEKYNEAINLIAEERQRQVEVEGFSIEQDDSYRPCELTDAAAAYLLLSTEARLFDFGGNLVTKYEIPDEIWPWASKSFKPTPGNRLRELVKAGALIVAAIEKEQRRLSNS